MASRIVRLSLVLSAAASSVLVTASPYEHWWTYDGFSGPDFWGLVNWEWKLCSKGQRQSPVNIDPKELLYDRYLPKVDVDPIRTAGYLHNTGQFLTLNVDEKTSKYPVMISGGPLGLYQYKLQQVVLHFGLKDDAGSEHAIDGEKFAGEIQIFGYNVDLYHNFSEALKMPHGIVGIAAVIEISKVTNSELKQLVTATLDVLYKGKKQYVPSFSAHHLLPRTAHYMTYDGSMTYPGCFETVTWIVMNKPIYIALSDLKILRDTQATEKKLAEPQFLGNNFRPLKPTNRRLLRTNINFKVKDNSSCSTMLNNMKYKANPWRKTNRFAVANYEPFE